MPDGIGVGIEHVGILWSFRKYDNDDFAYVCVCVTVHVSKTYLTLDCPTAFSLSRNNSKLASNKILQFRKHSLPSILRNQAFLKFYNPYAPNRFQFIQSLFYHHQIAPFHRNSAAGAHFALPQRKLVLRI